MKLQLFGGARRAPGADEPATAGLRGLSAQLTLFVVSMVAITTLLVGLVVYTGLTRLLEREATASLGQSTHLATTRLEATLETLRQDTRILAAMPPVRGIVRAQRNQGIDPLDRRPVEVWQERAVIVFSETLRNKPHYRTIRFLAPDGTELVKVVQLEGAISSSIARGRCEPCATRTRGVAPELPMEGPQPVRLTRADEDDGDAGPVVRAGMPLHDSDGNLQGTVTLDLALDVTLEGLRAVEEGSQGLHFYVLDEHGHFLLRPTHPVPVSFQSLYPEFGAYFTDPDAPAEAFVRPASEPDTAIHARRVPLNGTASASFIAMALAGSFQAITAESRAVARGSAMVVVVLSVGAGLLAALLVRIVVRPIRKLILAAHAVEAGDPEIELPVNAGNEVGILARAFRSMVDKLGQREAALAANASQLKRANGELQELIYVMAHDLRAPLRAVSGLASILEEDLGAKVDAQSARNLESLRARVRRMDEFIDALLEFSRAGLQVAPVEPVDVGALLNDVVAMLALAPAVKVTLPAFPPRLLTDRVRLEQVFANLIGNAVKHHPGTAPHVWVSVAEGPGGSWLFRVCDDGRGIAPEHQARIFRMFQTLGEHSTGECAGVGLAIVKKIVESVGGRVWVESVPDKGASFCFTWPRQFVLREEEDGEQKEAAGSPAILGS